MRYTVSSQSFESLASPWVELRRQLRRDSIFVSPGWLEAWWQTFGGGADLYLRVIEEGDNVIGIVPLKILGGKASFIGSADVCDYLDFAIAPGKEQYFFEALLEDLTRAGIYYLDLESLRPDSTVIKSLIGMVKERGYEASCHQVDISLSLDLPPTWEGYLEILTSKQRHEVRRKLRRLEEEAGSICYHTVQGGADMSGTMDLFLKLFRESRQDKATFMTASMESFFRSLAKTMAEVQLLRLGVLEIDESPVAALICFDYDDTTYLYNSGYDPGYRSLSAGLLSKALCIKDSIERGKKRFDLLRGAERYKYHLGGKETPIFNCQIVIRPRQSN